MEFFQAKHNIIDHSPNFSTGKSAQIISHLQEKVFSTGFFELFEQNFGTSEGHCHGIPGSNLDQNLVTSFPQLQLSENDSSVALQNLNTTEAARSSLVINKLLRTGGHALVYSLTCLFNLCLRDWEFILETNFSAVSSIEPF